MTKVSRAGVVVVALVAVAALGLWAAGAPEVEPDRLIVAYPQDVATFDIMISTAPPNEVRHMVFETLFAPNAELVPQPHLATSAEVSDDELTWTITLRDDVTFHDGQPMTSEDVVASWGRYREVGARAWELDRVDEVVAIDDYTVEFRLSAPLGSILESLAPTGGALAIYPKWVIDEIGTGDLVRIEHMVGTGPYMVDEIVLEERYVLRRNENYTQPGGEPSFLAGNRNAPIEYIEIVPIPDDATRVAALEAGDVDLIQTVPLDDAVRVDGNPETYVEITSPGYRIYYKFNVRHGPFTDPVLREAVRVAIDPEELMLAVGDPDYWRINFAMRYQEEQWMWSDVAFDYYESNLERGRELVAQSDYDGELIRFMASPGRALEYRTVIPMEQVLRDLGLNVEIQSVDAATFAAVRGDTTAWEFKHAGGGSMVGVVYLNASAQDRTGEFWPGVTDEWHEMMDVVKEEVDQDVRQRAVQRLHELHAEANHEMWIGDVFELAGARSNVSNVPPWFKLILWNIEKN